MFLRVWRHTHPLNGVRHFGKVFSSPDFLCAWKMGDSGLCLCRHWELCWWWDYMMGRQCSGQWTQMHFLLHFIAQRSWGSLLCPSSMPIASHCTTLSGSVHNSLKHPSISAILTTHPPFSMFGSGSVEMTGVEQHSKGQNQQPDQLYVKKMGCAAWCKWAWFSDNLATHYYSKTAHRKVAFYCGQPKHTYPIIRLSNQHLDMPYLWNGWIISAKENVPDTVQAHLCIIFERKINRKKV